MQNQSAQSPAEYATLPAGTIVKWGMPADALSSLKPLASCTGVGAMGTQGGFVDCTTLADTQKQYISDLPDGADKTLTFLDNPEDQNLADFLNAAEKRQTVQFYVELPNKRTSISIIALAGWQMAEIAAPANTAIKIEVKGKQNAITWGTVAASGGSMPTQPENNAETTHSS
ncbi:phage tail protein [Salmonella enterica]|nr:phage tail protein [Salmonella enterica]